MVSKESCGIINGSTRAECGRCQINIWQEEMGEQVHQSVPRWRRESLEKCLCKRLNFLGFFGRQTPMHERGDALLTKLSVRYYSGKEVLA